MQNSSNTLDDECSSVNLGAGNDISFRASRIWREISFPNGDEIPDGIKQIYLGEIDGVLVKGVFTPEEMRQVREKIEKKREFMSDVDYGKTLGAPMVVGGERGSIEAVKVFQDHLVDLFPQEQYESRIETLFRTMSGGRIVSLFVGDNGNAYAPATFRLIRPGCCLLIHRGNEFIEHSAFSELSKHVRLKNHLSYFVIIDPPKMGGELYIYNFPQEQLHLTQSELDFENCEKHVVNPRAGDMVVFHGGCIYHKINDISGDKERVSLGGFMGISHDDTRIYYWS